MNARVRGALAVGTLTGAMAALLLAGPANARVDGAAAAAKSFKRCSALNRVYPHGVGRVGARDRSKSTDPDWEPVTNFRRSNRLYEQNKHLDADKDKIACEKD